MTDYVSKLVELFKKHHLQKAAILYLIFSVQCLRPRNRIQTCICNITTVAPHASNCVRL